MCLCHHRFPVPRDSSRAFASLSTFNFGLLTSFSPTFQPFNRVSFLSPSSPHLCALCVLCGENSSSFRSSLIPRHSPLATNSFTIRTSKTPLPQLLYNPHLRAPLGSAGNKGLITPLESALTKKWGVGGTYPANADFLLRGAEGEEVLGAFDRLLEAVQEKLEVFTALDEITVRGVDDQEIGSSVAKEEMFVGARDF